MKTLFSNAFRLAHKIFPGGGMCLEFGVYVGNSYIWQAKEIKRRFKTSTLVGFDSWEGLPKEDSAVWFAERHREGGYKSSKDVVLKRLRSIGMHDDARIRFVDGFYSDSLTPDVRKGIKDIIFINIDVDIYRSTMELLDFVKPLLRPGVVIYWDDWKAPRDDFKGIWGEDLAWQEWTVKNTDVETETIEVNPINQRYMVVTKANGKTLESENLSMAHIRSVAFQISNGEPAGFERVKRWVKKMASL